MRLPPFRLGNPTHRSVRSLVAQLAALLGSPWNEARALGLSNPTHHSIVSLVELEFESKSGRGWIACTTDAIFLDAKLLYYYDVLIDFRSAACDTQHTASILCLQAHRPVEQCRSSKADRGATVSVAEAPAPSDGMFIPGTHSSPPGAVTALRVQQVVTTLALLDAFRAHTAGVLL